MTEKYNMCPKFELGDIVTLVNKPTDITMSYFCDDMDKFVGTEGEIEWAGYHGHYGQMEYRIKGMDGWYFLHSWLAPAAEPAPDIKDTELFGILGI